MDQIHPEYVMSEINNISSDDAIYTVDTGMTCVWGARYLQATGKRHMLGSFNHGSMAKRIATGHRSGIWLVRTGK